MNNNFGGLEKEYSDYKTSKIVILPIPYDKTRTWITGSSWNKLNTGKGPAAIITASQNMELYDIDSNKSVYEEGIHTLPAMKILDDAHKMVDAIESEVKKHLDAGKFVVSLGGEHCISTGPVKAYFEKHPKMSVLQLDAHADLRDEWEGGGKYSHASVMARIKELCPIVQVGIRSHNQPVSDKNVFFARNIFDNDRWMDDAISRLTDEVYITIDLDVFDPSIMPATGTPEPGGLYWYPVLKFLKKVCAQKKVIGFDVVELAPIDGQPASDFLAAKLIYKLLGYIF